MGCNNSKPEATVAAGTTDRTEYHRRHPGLHNPDDELDGIVSEVTEDIRDPDPTETKVLNVNSVDLNVFANCKLHHTDEYDITDPLQNVENKSLLVIRRGQPFKIALEFNRLYDRTKDELKLTFEFGKRPLATRGSHVEFVLSEKDEPKEWGALIKSKEGNSLWLEVMTPPTALVGKWKLNVDVVKKDETGVTVYRYTHLDPLYLLFNPWCKDDPVYMAEEDRLKEYILNETGKIYSGSQKRISPKPWNFGQFTGNVLDCTMFLMEMSRMKETHRGAPVQFTGNVLDCTMYLMEMSWMADKNRGDPVLVARKLSALVNSSDDRGVLTGNWSGDYAGGKSPLSWAGSVEIMEEYYKTKRPVKFGQCWVFSGVLTTVCRALGIPARSVTNFASAHDTEGSITIDIHFDADGKALDALNGDSVWNFHVWNEAWMARPDLPMGYGGWQAIDSTPQETSDYIYCLGPMSVLAIKRGEVNLPYDGKFVFAEVNADKIYWQRDANGAFENVYNDTAGVGKCMSTKRAHGRSSWEEYMNGMDNDREDVTEDYKFADDSEEERAAVRRANMHALKPTRIERPDAYEKGPKYANLPPPKKEKRSRTFSSKLRQRQRSNGSMNNNGYGMVFHNGRGCFSCTRRKQLSENHTQMHILTLRETGANSTLGDYDRHMTIKSVKLNQRYISAKTKTAIYKYKPDVCLRKCKTTLSRTGKEPLRLTQSRSALSKHRKGSEKFDFAEEVLKAKATNKQTLSRGNGTQVSGTLLKKSTTTLADRELSRPKLRKSMTTVTNCCRRSAIRIPQVIYSPSTNCDTRARKPNTVKTQQLQTLMKGNITIENGQLHMMNGQLMVNDLNLNDYDSLARGHNSSPKENPCEVINVTIANNMAGSGISRHSTKLNISQKQGDKTKVVDSINNKKGGKSNKRTNSELKLVDEGDPDDQNNTNTVRKNGKANNTPNVELAKSIEESKVWLKESPDVKFGLKFDANTMFGEEVKIIFTMTNTSRSERMVHGRISLSSMYYTGVTYKDVAHIEINDKLLAPEGSADVELVVPAESYLSKIMDHCIFRASSVCLVKETMQHFVEMPEVRLRKPHLTIKAPKKARVGEQIGVEVTFVSTLPVALTHCELQVEGSGLPTPIFRKQRDVKANARFVGEFDMTLKKKGEREIIVYFNSDQIQAVTGSIVIAVE